MPSLLLLSSQSSSQSLLWLHFLCGYICRLHLQGPHPQHHLVYSTSFLIIGCPRFTHNWKTQNSFTQNCHGSYNKKEKKMQLTVSVDLKRGTYKNDMGEGGRVGREISKGFPWPKISSTMPAQSNKLALQCLHLSFPNVHLIVCCVLLPGNLAITGSFKLKKKPFKNYKYSCQDDSAILLLVWISSVKFLQKAKSCCPQGMEKAAREIEPFGILAILGGVLFEGSWWVGLGVEKLHLEGEKEKLRYRKGCRKGHRRKRSSASSITQCLLAQNPPCLS